MALVLRFFATYAPFIYLLLALGFVFSLRRLVDARRRVHESIFGLERELSQRRLNQAVTALGLIGFLAIGEFVLIVFLVPSLPAVSILPTQTINPLGTPTTAFFIGSFVPIDSPTPGATATVVSNGCIPGQVMITSPQPGDQIQGTVTLTGTANIPNFGFFMYEFAPRGSTQWSTILAKRTPVQDGNLGGWDTSLLPAGDYNLRLVVTDNQARALPACVVPVTVVAP